MRERRSGHEVADRVDPRRGGAQRAVHLHEPALVELDARRDESERLHVGPAPGGDHEVVDLGGLARAVGEAHARLAGLHVLDRGPGEDLDALALEAALHQARDVGVLGGEHAVEHLEQQHLAAQAREAGGDLRAGGPRSHDGQARGQLAGAPTPARCRARARRAPRRGSSARPSRSRGSRSAAWSSSPPTRTPTAGALPPSPLERRRERGLAGDHLDPVLLEEPADAAGERPDDLLAPRLHRARSRPRTPATRSPKSPASRISLSRSAERRTALAGMHA